MYTAPTTRPTRPGLRARETLLSRPDGQRLLLDARRDLASALHEDSPPTLAALRLAKGLSQTDLAQASGMAQPHISRLENGHVDNPDARTIEQLLPALGCTADEFLAALHASVAAR